MPHFEFLGIASFLIPWSEIFTWNYTQNMTHIYSCFRLHKRKKKGIKKTRVLQAQGLDFNSELSFLIYSEQLLTHFHE